MPRPPTTAADLVLKPRSKILAAASGATPGPESDTVTCTFDSSAVTSTQGLLEFAGASRAKYPRTFATKAK